MSLPQRDPMAHPRPRLTGATGRIRPEFANDAPKALQRLAVSQVPERVRGPGNRGAWARGWCDGVRGLDAGRNPYMRGGSGWHHGMATLYRDGWSSGRPIYRLPPDATGMTERQYQRMAEVFTRVQAILVADADDPTKPRKRRRPSTIRRRTPPPEE